jgi:hypothetical protein
MFQQIAVRACSFKGSIVFVWSLADGEGDNQGRFFLDALDKKTKDVSCIEWIFPGLKNNRGDAGVFYAVRCGQYFVFPDPVALQLLVSFSQAAVKAVAFTKVGKFNDPPQKNFWTDKSFPYGIGSGKELLQVIMISDLQKPDNLFLGKIAASGDLSDDIE